LCGIVVTSRIEVTVKPAACSARSADSRPEPGRPLHFQRAHAVFLRLLGDVFGGNLRGIGGRLARALEPIVPADDQAMVLPCASVMVMVVLLNDEFTCAMPEAMFLRSRTADAGGFLAH
jgi:hypothetical protein